MKKIQIKIDNQDRTAAIYVSGKLLTLTIPQGWGYYRLGEYIVKTDEAFAAYLNASACETEEELNHFIPSFDKDWKEKLDWLNNKIEMAETVKVETVRNSVAVAFRNKLYFFKINEEGFYYDVLGERVDVPKEKFAAFCGAAICETEKELELMVPMLDEINPNWEKYAKLIRKSMQENILQEDDVSIPKKHAGANIVARLWTRFKRR